MARLNELGSKACDIHASLSCLVALLEAFGDQQFDVPSLGALVGMVSDKASDLANDIFQLEQDQKH